MRKIVLSLALLILGVATQANAALTISVGNFSVLAGTTTVNIPVSITGPDLISQTNINVTIVPDGTAAGEFGSGGPTVHFVGQNTVIPNSGDVDGNFMDTTAHLFGDAGTDDWNIFVFENLANPAAPIATTAGGAGANILINLVVDLTGFENMVGSKWLIRMGESNGNGSTDFGNLSGPIAATVNDGFVQIVPEPSSIMLGLFAATGLGVVALRKRRARRA